MRSYNFALILSLSFLFPGIVCSHSIGIQGVELGTNVGDIRKIYAISCKTETYPLDGEVFVSQSMCDLTKPIKIGQTSASNVRLFFYENILENIYVKMSWDSLSYSKNFEREQHCLLMLKEALEIKYPQASIRAVKAPRCNYCRLDDGYDFALPGGTINLRTASYYKKSGFLILEYSTKSYSKSSGRFMRARDAARELMQQEAAKKKDADRKREVSSLSNQL